MKIKDVDSVLLAAFLQREAEEFRWMDETGPEGLTVAQRQARYVDKMRKMLDDQLQQFPAGDYLEILSITNMGLTDRSLKLSLDPYKTGDNYSVCLPPNPTNGGMTVRKMERD